MFLSACYVCMWGELCMYGRRNRGSLPGLYKSRIVLKEQYEYWLWLGLMQTHHVIT